MLTNTRRVIVNTFAAIACVLAINGCNQGDSIPSVSSGFRVDASWPRKPARIAWGQMSGVAVDSKDRVWIFTRSTPAVQAYDASTGALVVEWHRAAEHPPRGVGDDVVEAVLALLRDLVDDVLQLSVTPDGDCALFHE